MTDSQNWMNWPDYTARTPWGKTAFPSRGGAQGRPCAAEDGKLRLAVTLPGMQSLDALAAALAKLMAAREGGSAGEAGAAQLSAAAGKAPRA